MDNQPKAKRILIVDDEPEAVGYPEELLGDHGYETLRASGGREALEVVRRERLDLVTLDKSMPDVSGIGVQREFRSATCLVSGLSSTSKRPASSRCGQRRRDPVEAYHRDSRFPAPVWTAL